MKIHTTIGLYLCGSWVANGVASEFLEDHVAYNKTMRPGRALIVDGKIVYLGYLSEEECLEFLRTNPGINRSKDTKPYL